MALQLFKKNHSCTTRPSRRAWLALVMVAVALGGCGISSGSSGASLAFGCMAERHQLTKGVEWHRVLPSIMRIQDETYDPMSFYFLQGQAYSLEIVNGDDFANNIWADDFLKEGIAVSSIRLGNGAPVYGCINGVRIAAKSTVKINFVAVTPGRYEIFNTALPIVPGQLTDAVFHVTASEHGINIP